MRLRSRGGAAADSRPPLLLVGPLPPPVNGQAVAFEMLVEGCRERGVEHRVVDIAHGARSAARIAEATWWRALEYVGILARYCRQVAFGRRTVYLIPAASRHGFLRDFVMIWVARLFGHRIVGHLHVRNYGEFVAAQPRGLRWLMRRTLAGLDRILVLGEGIGAAFDFDPRLRERVRVVPNGLPISDSLPSRGKELPAWPGAGPIEVLYLSNLVESKGYFDLLEAIAILRDEYGIAQLTCHFCGEFFTYVDDERVTSVAQARELFESTVAALGLEGQVRYHGRVVGEAKAEHLRRSHFFVLPTYAFSEAQPLSIIEAMAFGTVVVSTDYGAIPDLVEDGVTGRLVPPRDPRAIAAALHEYMTDPTRYAAASRASIERFEANFTREKHLDSLLSHLAGDAVTAVPQPESMSPR